MPGPLSEQAARNLSMSLPLLRASKDLLIEQMEIQLRPEADEQEPFGLSELGAMMLVEMLLERTAELIIEGRELHDLDDMMAEQRALGLSGRHYSRFGDALVPVIRDIAGPNLPAEVAGAWCDSFWAIIRAAQERREKAAA